MYMCTVVGDVCIVAWKGRFGFVLLNLWKSTACSKRVLCLSACLFVCLSLSVCLSVV